MNKTSKTKISRELDEENFRKKLTEESLKKAWNKEDNIYEKVIDKRRK